MDHHDAQNYCPLLGTYPYNLTLGVGKATQDRGETKMHKTLINLAVLGSLLLLGACAGSKWFDTNCSGNGAIENPDYCTKSLHPVAGPWAEK